MGKTGKAIGYGAGLIGLYLAVVYFKGTSSVLKSSGQAGSGIISALQGRSGRNPAVAYPS